jgi:hypothetical protein
MLSGRGSVPSGHGSIPLGAEHPPVLLPAAALNDPDGGDPSAGQPPPRERLARAARLGCRVGAGGRCQAATVWEGLGKTTPLRRFRFGVQQEAAQTGAQWLGIARQAEALGFDTLLMPDHFGPQFAPWAALGAAASVTSRLRWGRWWHRMIDTPWCWR